MHQPSGLPKVLSSLRPPIPSGRTLRKERRMGKSYSLQTSFHRLTCSLRETSRNHCAAPCTTPHQDSASHALRRKRSFKAVPRVQFPAPAAPCMHSHPFEHTFLRSKLLQALNMPGTYGSSINRPCQPGTRLNAQLPRNALKPKGPGAEVVGFVGLNVRKVLI